MQLSGWILASLSNGFISGTSWKCKDGSNSPSSNWKDITYDDNDWDLAVIVGESDSIDYVSYKDTGIWFKTTSEITSYYRGVVGKHFCEIIQ